MGKWWEKEQYKANLLDVQEEEDCRLHIFGENNEKKNKEKLYSFTDPFYVKLDKSITGCNESGSVWLGTMTTVCVGGSGRFKSLEEKWWV